MNYGVIPLAIANNEKEHLDYTVRFNEIGITTNRFIIVGKVEDITTQLKEGDAIVVISDIKYCKRTNAVLCMLEKVLAKGITVCLYNKCMCIIQPDELPLLQKLVQCLMHQDKKMNAVVKR